MSAGDENPFLMADTDSPTVTEVVDLVIYYYQTDFYTRDHLQTRMLHDFKKVLMPGGFLDLSVE